MRCPTRALRPSGPQMRPDLLLNRLLDAVDLLHTVHVLVNQPWIDPDILGAGLFLSLQQQTIGTLARHDKGESEPILIGVPEGVAHRAYVLSHRLQRAFLLQHGRWSMLLLDVLGQTVEHACNRGEPDPRQRKPTLFDIGLHGDPLLLSVLAGERLTYVKVSAEPLPLFRLPVQSASHSHCGLHSRSLDPLFVCDEMLVRLARLLRAAGHDALLAEPGAADDALLALTRAEKRVLLTRDRRLAGTAGVETLAIEADSPQEQAAELSWAYPVDWLRAPLTRCLVDNAPLRPATPAEIGRAPASSRSQAGPFTACPGCGRLYWPGSHARRIMDKLRVLADQRSIAQFGPHPQET